jgi:enoyl-CoA hydratase
MQNEPRFHQIEIDGPIIIWNFHNPPKNLLSRETSEELASLVEQFEADPDLRVGILTSALSDVFIQHYDVSALVQLAKRLRDASIHDPLRFAFQRPIPRGTRRLGPKPIIAAINAWVSGGGVELALTCDFRFMSRNATLGLIEVLLGILPGGGGTQRMARLLGTARALEMMMLGKVISADEAERIGLVHHVCDPQQLMPTVISFAKQLAARPPLPLALIKRCIYEGIEMPLEEGLALERYLFMELMRSDDAYQLMIEYVAGGQDRDYFMQWQNR